MMILEITVLLQVSCHIALIYYMSCLMTCGSYLGLVSSKKNKEEKFTEKKAAI